MTTFQNWFIKNHREKSPQYQAVIFLEASLVVGRASYLFNKAKLGQSCRVTTAAMALFLVLHLSVL